MSKYWTKVLRSECPELGEESVCSTLTLLPKSLLTETHWNCLLQSRPAVQCTVSVHCTVSSEGNTLTHISPPPSTLSTLDNSPDSSVCHSLELQPLTNFDYLIFNQLNSTLEMAPGVVNCTSYSVYGSLKGGLMIRMKVPRHWHAR